jgi:hypothetical protein
MSSSDPPFHTVGAAARRYGCRPWQVRRLFERGLLPPAPRVGAYRVFATADLPHIERAAAACCGAPSFDRFFGGREINVLT